MHSDELQYLLPWHSGAAIFPYLNEWQHHIPYRKVSNMQMPHVDSSYAGGLSVRGEGRFYRGSIGSSGITLSLLKWVYLYT